MASKYDSTNIKTFDNEVLTQKFEHSLITALDMNQFTTINHELSQNPGMKYKVRTYKGTGVAEDVEMGEGNTALIGNEFSEEEYEVKVTQATTKYYDEQYMNDPMAVDAAIRHLSDAMTNDLTAKIVAELDKATMTVDNFNPQFEDVIDALAMFPDDEAIKSEGKYLLMNKADSKELIKNCKDSLQYVTDYVRSGYLGTIAGVNIYSSAAVKAGTAYLATREAVTTFIKKGVALHTDYDIEKRENTLVGNVVRVTALTDATKAVKLTVKNTKSVAAASTVKVADVK